MSNITNLKINKFYTTISMLYITLMIAANVLIYKEVSFMGETMTIGSIITPSWFIIGNIVTEVYGYVECKKLIWRSLLCSFIFAIICKGLITIPSPVVQYQNIQPHFNYILGGLPRIFIVSILGIFSGLFTNAFLLAKFKMSTKGKYLWFRIISAGIAGDIVFTIITLTLDLYTKVPVNDIVTAITISCSIKILVLVVAAYPVCLIIYFLKQSEGVDKYDYGVDFNPFKFTEKPK